MSTYQKNNEHLPWVEQFRPQSLADVLGHHQIIKTINKLIDTDNLPHLLFYGPPGTGKTSTILACAKKMFGTELSSMILELNASDDNGINIVRNQIKDFAETKKMFGTGIKLIVLDEADNLSIDAQNALRRVMEKYSGNVRFCLICNYVSKIINAIQSRCMNFRFSLLKKNEIVNKIYEIAAIKNCSLDSISPSILYNISSGDMRLILNTMQACYIAQGKIDEDTIYKCTGTPHPTDITILVDYLMNDNFNCAYRKINQLKMEKGLTLSDIIENLTPIVVEMNIPELVKCYILKNMADIENNLIEIISDDVQLGGLVSIFIIAKQKMLDVVK